MRRPAARKYFTDFDTSRCWPSGTVISAGAPAGRIGE